MILIILFTVLIIAAGIFTYYKAKNNKTVQEDQGSKDRLAGLNEVLTSIFGIRWPFIMTTFAILLTMIMVLLYLLSQKEYDGQTSILTKLLTAIIIIFAAVMIFFAAQTFRNQIVKKNTGDIPNYTPSIVERTKLNEILMIAGIAILLLIIIGGFFWYG